METCIAQTMLSRTKPLGIVAKANSHTLRVAGKHLKLVGVHAMPTYGNYANKSNFALSRNPVAHDAFRAAVVHAQTSVCLRL